MRDQLLLKCCTFRIQPQAKRTQHMWHKHLWSQCIFSSYQKEFEGRRSGISAVTSTILLLFSALSSLDLGHRMAVDPLGIVPTFQAGRRDEGGSKGMPTGSATTSQHQNRFLASPGQSISAHVTWQHLYIFFGCFLFLKVTTLPQQITLGCCLQEGNGK